MKWLITIDGPAGSGKTTVSRILADRLGYDYIDTGALYRAVALIAIDRDIEPNDDEELERLCAALELEFKSTALGSRLFADGRDITDDIRTPEVTMMASAVSARQVVRDFLLNLQRHLGRRKGAVFEGRDMGTVVFPNADFKFFLDASEQTRARRRYLEMGGKNSQTLGEVRAAMHRRDRNDSLRKLAPLRAADDAVRIDSTGMNVEQVVALMLSHIEKHPYSTLGRKPAG